MGAAALRAAASTDDVATFVDCTDEEEEYALSRPDPSLGPTVPRGGGTLQLAGSQPASFLPGGGVAGRMVANLASPDSSILSWEEGGRQRWPAFFWSSGGKEFRQI